MGLDGRNKITAMTIKINHHTTPSNGKPGMYSEEIIIIKLFH